MENMQKYFKHFPGTPPIDDYRCSVHRNTYRLGKAKEQASIPPTDVHDIIGYVNNFLKAIGIDTVESPIIDPSQVNYKKIMADNALKDLRDIIWMKFTKDGYLGVVATSNDINFDIPSSASEYDKREKQEWKHNSAGILVHQLGKEWDTSFVLVFPLPNIPTGYERGDIERAVGNYLIDKKVPIIDFYSHNY